MAVWVFREKWSVWVKAVWVGVRTKVMRGWIGEMRVIGQRKSKSDCFHEWIGVRNEKRKLTVRWVRGSWCVKCGSGLRNEWIEAWTFFAWCVDRSIWLGVWIGASQALCVCERVASSACERVEWKMFEVKMRTELIFRLFRLILRSNWKYFQSDPIYRTYQTCYFSENDFWISFSIKTNGPNHILHLHSYTKNLLFLFYISIFTKHPHQFIYSITSFI